MSDLFTPDEQDVIRRMTRGRVAGEFLALNQDVLAELEHLVFKRFTAIDPLNDQKFDNTQYLVLSLKIRVIRELVSLLNSAVSDGDYAENELRTLNSTRR
jgi:hypothetical protein